MIEARWIAVAIVSVALASACRRSTVPVAPPSEAQVDSEASGPPRPREVDVDRPAELEGPADAPRVPSAPGEVGEPSEPSEASEPVASAARVVTPRAVVVKVPGARQPLEYEHIRDGRRVVGWLGTDVRSCDGIEAVLRDRIYPMERCLTTTDAGEFKLGVAVIDRELALATCSHCATQPAHPCCQLSEATYACLSAVAPVVERTASRCWQDFTLTTLMAPAGD